ncbi:roadblock/LC7 domain-containing protein [Pelotalea chapellei]|uniref:Roadblock/LC7 domain-containing protein n=1 Tax=Pelotalea chapellei TaxID=44671 RepID=A0ABS5U543_9BACT|nr:roadblock/LC7 domain-containing protein [Pelotalea chapellei]MBT1070786.1 roadblock/LC7 domain-containing protein [Pelotalea chapellei]
MPYKQIMKDLVEKVPGATGAIVLDWEGEAVQEYCYCEPYEIRFVAAHQGLVLSQLRELQQTGQGGAIEEVVVTSSDRSLITGCINQDYSLMLSIDRSCPVALALHHFRTTITVLRKEI